MMMRTFFKGLTTVLLIFASRYYIGIRCKPQEATTNRNHFTEKQGQAVKLPKVVSQ